MQKAICLKNQRVGYYSGLRRPTINRTMAKVATPSTKEMNMLVFKSLLEDWGIHNFKNDITARYKRARSVHLDNNASATTLSDREVDSSILTNLPAATTWYLMV